MDSKSACAIDAQKASAVCPASMVPMLSMVPETIAGMRQPISSRTRSIASSAAFTLRVSCAVSTTRTSAPPSANALACV